jgi:molybdopterin converting factor small subunit
LWQLHQRGRLKLDFRPQRVSVGYHVPCHLRALGVGAPAENLMQLVPGLRVTRIEKGCSGCAGLYGLKRDTYWSSLRAGFELIDTVRKSPFQVGMTDCSTCNIQMEQGTTKPTIHPIKLLALAYGLAPEVASLLRAQFAVAREIADRHEVSLNVPEVATIGDVHEALLTTMPRLRAVLPHVRWAVDSEFVAMSHPVSTTSEIALIPPVSGG